MSQIKKYIAAAVVCGGLFSAWYVVSPTQQAKYAASIQVAEKKIRSDSFTDYLNHKVTSMTRLSNTKRRVVIYDNDAANDDVLALILIGNDPSIDLKAITVNGTGQAHAKPGAANMMAVAAVMGKTFIPVAYGTSEPLSTAGKPFPEAFRSSTDILLKNLVLPPVDVESISDNAVAVMRNIITDSKDKVTILATGPLTNVAQVFAKYPELKKRVERIVIMGGAVKTGGNIQVLDHASDNTVSEWNFYNDPKAAHAVIHSGVPITLVSLDATNQVPITKEFFEATAIEDQPDLKLAHEALRVYVDQEGEGELYKNIYAWDELAAMVMLDPTIAVTESMTLKVDPLNGNVKPAVKGEQGAKVDVVTKIIHPEAFLRNYVAMVKSNHLFVQRKYNQDGNQFRARQIKQESSHA